MDTVSSTRPNIYKFYIFLVEYALCFIWISERVLVICLYTTKDKRKVTVTLCMPVEAQRGS